MTQETDVAALVEQARVVLLVHSVRIGLRTILRHVVTLTCLADVAVQNHLTIHSNLDTVALHPDFFPAARALWETGFRSLTHVSLSGPSC